MLKPTDLFVTIRVGLTTTPDGLWIYYGQADKSVKPWQGWQLGNPIRWSTV